MLLVSSLARSYSNNIPGVGAGVGFVGGGVGLGVGALLDVQPKGVGEMLGGSTGVRIRGGGVGDRVGGIVGVGVGERLWCLHFALECFTAAAFTHRIQWVDPRRLNLPILHFLHGIT